MTQLSPEQEARFEELYENTMSMFFSREQKKERLRKHLASEISLALAAREKEVEEALPNALHEYHRLMLENPEATPLERRRYKDMVVSSLRSPKEDKPQ